MPFPFLLLFFFFFFNASAESLLSASSRLSMSLDITSLYHCKDNTNVPIATCPSGCRWGEVVLLPSWGQTFKDREVTWFSFLMALGGL